MSKTLRFLQSQKGLRAEEKASYLADLIQSTKAQALIAYRQSELDTYTFGVGLKAAQTCSAVMRLSPGVNHVSRALSVYATNVRSRPKPEVRRKSQRLFEKIQNELKKSVGDERIAFIERTGGPIKIISDAPVEWLPIGNLPLSLRYNCSRINATPGNLMMGQLTNTRTLVFSPGELKQSKARWQRSGSIQVRSSMRRVGLTLSSL
jgi:hypothetical protein